MSREIKFRGMTIAGEWVYGLLSISQGKGSQPEKGYYISNSDGSPWAFSVRPETVGQYTGLKDSTRTKEFPEGKEIYEGAIIKIVVLHMDMNHWNELGEELDVEYVESGFQPFSAYDSDCGEYLKSKWCEIIGNIHEPKL